MSLVAALRKREIYANLCQDKLMNPLCKALSERDDERRNLVSKLVQLENIKESYEYRIRKLQAMKYAITKDSRPYMFQANSELEMRIQLIQKSLEGLEPKFDIWYDIYANESEHSAEDIKEALRKGKFRSSLLYSYVLSEMHWENTARESDSDFDSDF